MAEQIQIAGGPNTAKIRSPWAVVLLPFVTFGLYWFFWYYYINRELRDLGKQRNLPLGESPGTSLLAVTLGALIVVPAIMSLVGTFKRLKMAQRALDVPEPINGWLYWAFAGGSYGLLGSAYEQTGMNKIWRLQSGQPMDWIDRGLAGPTATAAPTFAPPVAPPPPPPPGAGAPS